MKRLPLVSANTSQTCQGNIELAPHCYTYKQLQIRYYPTDHYKETPLAFANTFTNPPREYKSWHLTATQSQSPPSGIYKYLYRPARGTRAGIWLPYNYKPLWHLRIPLRARQRNIELAPHCCTLTNTEPPYPPILSANQPLRTTPIYYTLFDPLHPLIDVLAIQHGRHK